MTRFKQVCSAAWRFCQSAPAGWTFSMPNPGSIIGLHRQSVGRRTRAATALCSVPEQRRWMRFPALRSDPKRRRASLAAAVQKTLPTQGSASLAEHTDSTRSVCLTWPRWERGRLARPGAAKGRCSGLRPRLRTGRPRSQRGFVTPRNVQSPGPSQGGDSTAIFFRTLHRASQRCGSF